MRNAIATLLSLAFVLFCLTTVSCKKETTVDDPTVAANIKKYETTWDAIINQGKPDLFNTTNFNKNAVFHSKPSDIIVLIVQGLTMPTTSPGSPILNLP